VQSVLQQRSDHRIIKRSVDSLNILVPLTLNNKLTLPLSSMGFYSRDRIHFQMQPRYII